MIIKRKKETIMKAEIEEAGKGFKPFVVRVFFETLQDVDEFNDDWLESEDIDATNVGQCIKRAVADHYKL
jgi:hypothetical protein